MHTTHHTSDTNEHSAWRNDREVIRVIAHQVTSDIDDRYTEDDYRSALRRAMASNGIDY